MKKGRAGTMTHDYKRNGTTTLFAALNMLDGKVIGACMPRHRHREFLRFLKLVDQQTPTGLQLCHSQDPSCKALDQSAPPLPFALHTHLGLLAQYG
jgi:hypothetical protein